MMGASPTGEQKLIIPPHPPLEKSVRLEAEGG
jgi:hypothetical protein